MWRPLVEECQAAVDSGVLGEAFESPWPPGDGGKIEQHPHAVLLRPLEGAVDIVDQGDVDLGLALRAEGVPGNRQPHGVKTDGGDAAEVRLGDKGLEMLTDALVIGGRTEGRLQLRGV